jgi:hypothetical protein
MRPMKWLEKGFYVYCDGAMFGPFDRAWNAACFSQRHWPDLVEEAYIVEVYNER